MRGRPKSLSTVHREIQAEIDVLNTKFNHHEFKCEQNNKEITFRLRRLEAILWVSSGSIILFLAGIITKVTFP